MKQGEILLTTFLVSRRRETSEKQKTLKRKEFYDSNAIINQVKQCWRVQPRRIHVMEREIFFNNNTRKQTPSVTTRRKTEGRKYYKKSDTGIKHKAKQEPRTTADDIKQKEKI